MTYVKRKAGPLNSPLPWSEFRDGESHDIIDADGWHVATIEACPEQDANAALIIAAVNKMGGV